MQTDPIGYKDQMNLYAYVGNDPGNATDPSGECPSCIFGAIVGAVTQLVVEANKGNLDKAAQGIKKGDYKEAAMVAVRTLASAGMGALSGGANAVALAGTATVVSKVAQVAAVGAVTSAATQTITEVTATTSNINGTDTVANVATAAAIGAVSAVVGAGIGTVLSDATEATFSAGAATVASRTSSALVQMEKKEVTSKATNTPRKPN